MSMYFRIHTLKIDISSDVLVPPAAQHNLMGSLSGDYSDNTGLLHHGIVMCLSLKNGMMEQARNQIIPL